MYTLWQSRCQAIAASVCDGKRRLPSPTAMLASEGSTTDGESKLEESNKTVKRRRSPAKPRPSKKADLQRRLRRAPACRPKSHVYIACVPSPFRKCDRLCNRRSNRWTVYSASLPRPRPIGSRNGRREMFSIAAYKHTRTHVLHGLR